MDEDHHFQRYLAAKKSVDDRALNKHVWERLRAAVHTRGRQAPLRVLEVGGGIGTMVERMVDWGLLRQAQYTLIDQEPKNLRWGKDRLKAWAQDKGFELKHSGEDGLTFSGEDLQVTVKMIVGEALEFAAKEEAGGWDLLVAHAFLDLVDAATALPFLFSRLKRGGLFYFTINYDVETIFQPVGEAELDEHILQLYNRTMDKRTVEGKPSGDSRTGRHLFQHIPAAGGEILAAGSSDWVVHPQGGGYPEDEAYFLRFILQTIEQALEGHPDLDKERLAAWVAERQAQLACGELIYIAHQLDFVGRKTKE